MLSTRLIISLLITTVVFGDEYQKPSEPSDFKRSLSKDCVKSYTTTCLKLDIVSWVDKLNEEDDYSVLPGVSLVKETTSARSSSSTANTAEIVSELARDFPNDPDSRLDVYLLKKVTNYLDTHSFRFNLWDSKSVKDEEARGGGGGGGGGGKGGGKGGGGYGLIFAAAAMMKGTLFALALGGLAAIAGKALLTALISLLLSTIIGLKSLAHHGHKSTTYEVISKPVYAHANSHSYAHDDHHGYGHSSYGRSFDGPLPAGLRDDYKPAQ